MEPNSQIGNLPNNHMILTDIQARGELFSTWAATWKIVVIEQLQNWLPHMRYISDKVYLVTNHLDDCVRQTGRWAEGSN